MIAWLALGIAFAQDPLQGTIVEAPPAEEAPPVGPVPDIVREVGSGLGINWTRLVLVARASARSHGAEDTRAVEELARREIQIGMEQGAARIGVTRDRSLADVLEEPRVGEALRSRIARWEVAEATYHASGRVSLMAELSLQELMKPWTLAHVRHEPPADREPRYTGLIVDARGTDVTPVWSPRVLGADGAVLYDGSLWEEEAVTLVPVVYVPDVGHAAAARAGALPMTVRAEAARGGDVVLGADDTVRFRTALQGARILGEGTVVLVVDP